MSEAKIVTHYGLARALQTMFDLIESGYLVRDTSQDHAPGWAMKQLEPARKLGAAHAALKRHDTERDELLALLADALEFAEGYEDVQDRSDGTVQANPAMTLCSTLRDALEKAGKS